MKLVIINLILIFSLNCEKTFARIPAGEVHWHIDSKKDGFTIYTRKEENSDIFGFKLSGVLKAPIPQILTTLREVKTSSKWVTNQKIKKTIEYISEKEEITYSQNDMSWPVNDRDFLLHNILKLDYKKKLLFVSSKSVIRDDFPEATDHIRAHIFYSNIGLRPISENETYVEWTIYADPKGSLPNWLVNFYQKRWPIKFFKALEKRANEQEHPLLPELRKMLDQLLKLTNKEKLFKPTAIKAATN